MDKEMQSIYKNDVWDLVELSKQTKAIGCKWLFKEMLAQLSAIKLIWRLRVSQSHMVSITMKHFVLLFVSNHCVLS